MIKRFHRHRNSTPLPPRVHQPTKRSVRATRMKIVKWLSLGILSLFLLTFVGGYIWIAKDLPEPNKVTSTSENATTFLDREGKPLYQMFKEKNRIPVASEEISEYLKQATVAVEDKDFYKHKGFDLLTFVRIPYNYFFRKGRVVGGSTITQQLVKNTLLDGRRTPERKLKELLLAIEIERRFSKDQILTMYLNEVPYGGAYYGIGTAAKAYFGKSPKDLNLLESAVLAGLPQSPTVYSPFTGKEGAWQTRTKGVLRRMREDGYITKDEEEQAVESMANLVFQSPKVAIEAPHFVFYVKEQLEKELGPEAFNKGLTIKTTLSLDVQQKVQEAVTSEVAKLKNYKVGNGAAIVLDVKENQILAMVGSADFNEPQYGKYNVVTALRQPGSTIKPLLYGLALEKGYTAASALMDTPTEFPTDGGPMYKPVNYDGRFRGPVLLRNALGNSLNIPSVKLQALVTTEEFLKKLYENGLDTFEPTPKNLQRFGLALTLGGGESTLMDMTNAFATYARAGVYKTPQYVLEVTDHKGNVIIKADEDVNERRVYSPETSFIISDILADNSARTDAFGPNSLLNVAGKRVAVKTGTTNDKRDNYAIGYTKSVAVGVWVGNNDNSPMNQKIASGITGATPIWHNVMKQLLTKYEDGFLPQSDNIVQAEINAVLGGLPLDAFPKKQEYFVKGTEPTEVSPWYKRLRISRNNGKLANDLEIAQGNYEDRTYVVFTENDPVSKDGRNRWQEGIDTWVASQNNELYRPPKETSDSSSEDVAVSIKSPSGGQEISGNNIIEVRAVIASSPQIKEAKLVIDGAVIKTYGEGTREINEYVELTPGTYSLQVTARNEKGKTGESTISFTVKN